jgi:NlpC/P60 family putative phage cell wall peptidase
MTEAAVGPEAVVSLARKWIGTPYRHQSACRGHGADCLGLVRGIWRDLHGAEPCRLPAYSESWFECLHPGVLEEGLACHFTKRDCGVRKPGDVLVFRIGMRGQARHIGVLTRLDALPSFVHAYTGHGVVESHLTASWQRRIVASFAFPDIRQQ